MHFTYTPFLGGNTLGTLRRCALRECTIRECPDWFHVECTPYLTYTSNRLAPYEMRSTWNALRNALYVKSVCALRDALYVKFIWRIREIKLRIRTFFSRRDPQKRSRLQVRIRRLVTLYVEKAPYWCTWFISQFWNYLVNVPEKSSGNILRLLRSGKFLEIYHNRVNISGNYPQVISVR